MNILEGQDMSHFKGDILRHRHASSSNPFLLNIRSRNISKTIQDIRIQDVKIVQYLIFLKCDLLISRLHEIEQENFCTPHGAMDLTYQMNYVPVFLHVCSQRNQGKMAAQVQRVFFASPFRTPCISSVVIQHTG